jgi:enoyl-CoA hydratase/carnithine racemase
MFSFEVDDRILHVVLGRPEKRNALIPSLLPAAQAELVERAGDPNLCGLVLRSQGPFFCAGYDISSIPSEPAADGRMVGELDDFVAALAGLDLPTVAWVQGGAYGAGFELALACDLRLTTDRARWCMPPAKLGLLYSLDGMCRLQRAVGEQRARYLLTTAAVISGADAATWGLALEALDDDQSLERRGAELLGELRGVNAASARGAKALLESVSPQLDPNLVAQAETLRAELFAVAQRPPKP